MIVLQDKAGAPRISLHAMTPDAAATLGQAFAAIDPWVRYPFSPDALAQYFNATESGAPRFAVAIDGTLAGVIGTRANWLRGPYLQFLGIVPSYQNQGAGQLLLAWFEGEARARGERNIWVAASDFNATALSFYERHGFQRAARLDGLIQDGVTEILLRKKLGPQK